MSDKHRADYSSEFFDNLDCQARSSAAVVVPIVMRLLQPRTVVDIGCGRGVWLEQFLQAGVTDMLGVDGDWLDPADLWISQEKFRVARLDEDWAIRESYDLAVCLEVAEHLPARGASSFVERLCQLSEAVLFSAALPGQGGTSHINEQWPEFWQERFMDHGFVRLDPVRRLTWQNEQVAWYYQQNIYLFVKERLVIANAALAAERELTDGSQLTLVRRDILHRTTSIRGVMSLLPGLLAAAVSRRLRRIGAAGNLSSSSRDARPKAMCSLHCTPGKT